MSAERRFAGLEVRVAERATGDFGKDVRRRLRGLIRRDLAAAGMFLWPLADEARLWIARSETYRTRYRQLAPDGIDPAVFDGRGAYGDYFGGQARVVGGY